MACSASWLLRTMLSLILPSGKSQVTVGGGIALNTTGFAAQLGRRARRGWRELSNGDTPEGYSKFLHHRLAGYRDVSLGLLEGIRPSGSLLGHGRNSISLYTGHDASVAISKNGRVQCVLELERLFDKRYYFPADLTFRVDWLRALSVVRDHCSCEGGCPKQFEYGVIVLGPTRLDVQMPGIVGQFFVVQRWHSVEHHEAHAALGFFGSPFRSALVVSYDGGGSDGSFNVYHGFGTALEHIARLNYNFGSTYMFLATLLPEVTGIPIDNLCSKAFTAQPMQAIIDPEDLQRFLDIAMNWTLLHGEPPFDLSIPGKLMGYSALGKAKSEVRPWIRAMLEKSFDYTANRLPIYTVPNEVLRLACSSTEGQHTLAASIQQEFESLFHDIVAELWEPLSVDGTVEGVVLTGGCALNVLTNQLIYDVFTHASGLPCSKCNVSAPPPLDMYVPPSPNDSGLTLGGLWAIDPPGLPQLLQYLGFRVWDEHILDSEARLRHAKSLSALGGVDYLAELLSGGSAWVEDGGNVTTKPIIAVVRGHQEFGPRALGHRSLLAVPDSIAMRDRMNTLKFREWYRPVAPMMADEALEQVFGRSIKSPYMSMAPQVRADLRERFPALVHLDGTARHQSVSKDVEPWLHKLLLAIGKRTGLAALINTSFNSKGKPIVNSVRASLQMLDELPDLDYVLIEDWLFRASQKRSKAAEDDATPNRARSWSINGAYAGL